MLELSDRCLFKPTICSKTSHCLVCCRFRFEHQGSDAKVILLPPAAFEFGEVENLVQNDALDSEDEEKEDFRSEFDSTSKSKPLQQPPEEPDPNAGDEVGLS